MRILHVGKYYPPARGGMETALGHAVEGLGAAGHDVRVVVAGHGRRTSREDLPHRPGALIRVGVLGTWNSQPLMPGLPRILAEQLRTFQPDLVHLHLPNPLACWAWLRIAPGAPEKPRLAIWHHADIVRQRLGGRLVAPVIERCLALADGICVSSESWRRTAATLAGRLDDVRVIPFGIDASPFLHQEPTGAGPFVFVGRLVRYKGVHLLLEAMAGLPDARLDIVGTGPQQAALRRRAGQADLAGRVRFLGDVSETDLPAVLAGCRALVLPSLDRSETFGLVLLEAMAAALPLVTTDLPTGVGELNQPGQTGWVAAVGEVASLREQLAAVMADPAEARRRGRHGRDLVCRRYTRERLAADLTAWYDQLVRDGRGNPLRR